MKPHERFRLHVQVDAPWEGTSRIAVAFAANVPVAVAKTVAAVITGS
jgi:hypothetical protein